MHMDIHNDIIMIFVIIASDKSRAFIQFHKNILKTNDNKERLCVRSLLS